jgi:hypothetical protein
LTEGATNGEAKTRPAKYPRGEFIKNAQGLFGVKPEVVVGALHGDPAPELTKAEVQKAVNRFLRRRAK